MTQIHTKGVLTDSQQYHFALMLDRMDRGCFCLTPEKSQEDRLKRIISIAYLYGFVYTITRAENSLYFSFLWGKHSRNGRPNSEVDGLKVLAKKAANYLNDSLPNGYYVGQFDGEYWLIDEQLFAQIHDLLPSQDHTEVSTF